MALVIYSNVASLNARRNFDKLADRALAQVDTPHGKLGTVQDSIRVDDLEPKLHQREFAGPRKRIRDADFAAQAATQNRDQDPQQAHVAMLSHANSLRQLAFSLLR